MAMIKKNLRPSFRVLKHTPKIVEVVPEAVMDEPVYVTFEPAEPVNDTPAADEATEEEAGTNTEEVQEPKKTKKNKKSKKEE